MSLIRSLSIGVLGCWALLLLSGCSEPSPARAPQFQEDDYTSEVAVQGKWSVKYDGRVFIEVDADGTVNVYGIDNYYNSAHHYPNVKVSGSAKFTVHTCNRVTADEGVKLSAYNCDTVRARKGASVQAYNCRLVEAYGAVETVTPHGTTRVKYLPDPAQPLPVEKPLSVNTAQPAPAAASPAPEQTPRPEEAPRN